MGFQGLTLGVLRDWWVLPIRDLVDFGAQGLVGFCQKFRDWRVSVRSSKIGGISYSGISGFCEYFSPKISIIWGGSV
jgi:hypothetical protein